MGLLLPLWLPLEAGLRWRNRPALPVTLVVLGLLIAGLTIRHEKPTANRPLHIQVAYYQNADTKQAVWASDGLLTTDDWNRQFFPKSVAGPLTELFPTAPGLPPRIWLKNPAPVLATAPPVAELISDESTGSGRQLTFWLRAPRGAAHLEVGLFASKAGDLKTVRINGEPLAVGVQQTIAGPAVDLVFFGLPVGKSITLIVKLAAGSPLRVLLYDQSVGLPPEFVKTPRPAWVVPEQGRSSNLTIVGKSYPF